VKIVIPKFVARIWDVMEEWANVTVFVLWRRHHVRRVDIAVTVMIVGGVTYYYFFYSWQMALMAAMTAGMILISVWIL
jgi:hypothetical protein